MAMTEAESRSSAGASASEVTEAIPPRARLRRGYAVPIALQALAMISIGALVYSSAADWFAAWGHNAEISGYTSAVAEVPTDQIEAMQRAAQEYNDHLPAGVLRDPYGMVDPAVADIRETAAYQAYEDVLSVVKDGVIGFLSYPALGIGLPIRHGTADATISSGVGHLYGSSLPIGGPSTHSVLTSHSGLLHARLFSALPNAAVGDVFQVNTLGQAKYYQVQSIETVLPEETQNLIIAPGEDRITLFTCTPIGVNTHRLMVHAVRVSAPPSEAAKTIVGDGLAAGFPWWAAIFVGGSAAVGYLVFVPPRRRRTREGAQGVS